MSEQKPEPKKKREEQEERNERDIGKSINDGVSSADILQCSNCGKRYFRGQAHSC
ncbi:hypothetical protein ACFOOP_07380 [Marinicaulis aureus]|uniref:Uncharacterized protein n=1 Tax=Hyphococcus aureus TaxID=2666033 RepID=A0ABW1KVF0_9PROT